MIVSRKYWAALFGVLMPPLLSSCSTVRDTFSVQKEAPDEFAAPPPSCTDLSVPPSLNDLPKPQTCGEKEEPFPHAPAVPENSKTRTVGQKAFLKKIQTQSSS